VPNDGIDDRAPIQAAIDAAVDAGGGTVCLPSGRWTLTRAPAGSYDRFAALSTHGAHVDITGTGPGTVLEMVGDQGAATTSVISLDPGAHDITIERLTIDTSGMTNTDEQTHAIAIGSGVCATSNGTCSMPVADVTMRDVRFEHPTVAGSRKGDCIRLFGNTASTRVERVTIVGSSFTSCARSGIAVQRNVFSLAVLGNHFGEKIGDTAFDSEPTGGEGDDGLRLIGNSFADTKVTFSASITSYHHATITGNTFVGRGINLYRTQDVLVADNTFDVNAPTAAGVIEVQNVASGDKIDNNMIRRHGVAGRDQDHAAQRQVPGADVSHEQHDHRRRRLEWHLSRVRARHRDPGQRHHVHRSGPERIRDRAARNCPDDGRADDHGQHGRRTVVVNRRQHVLRCRTPRRKSVPDRRRDRGAQLLARSAAFA
jgi:hypothetical protein